MSETTSKTREMRLRRWAAGEGLTLTKSRKRVPSAIDYGRWHLTDQGGRPVIGDRRGVTLDEVERLLTSAETLAS